MSDREDVYPEYASPTDGAWTEEDQAYLRKAHDFLVTVPLEKWEALDQPLPSTDTPLPPSLTVKPG